MIDEEITKFYNLIKADQWPTIKNYVDFINLPSHIKQECYADYNLTQRKKDICDRNYWVNLNTTVYVYKNLAFVPVPKCASTHYITIFQNLGWKKTKLVDIDRKTYNFFGVILHPMQRHAKGITELIIYSYRPATTAEYDFTTADYQKLEEDLRIASFRYLISNIYVGDDHSMPYYSMFGDFLHEVNWIPLELLSVDEQACTIKHFCRLHGHDIDIPVQPIMHKSSQCQLRVYNQINDIFLENKTRNNRLYHLFDYDLKFFYNLLDIFSKEWKHITQ
jgi:hypothetical protein